jgi:hypothetical protein
MPQVRPIKDFWAYFKSLVYDGGWEAQNLVQLKSRIMLCYGKIDPQRIQNIFGSTRRRLNRVGRHGF